MKIELSDKQCEFIRNGNHRWNTKIGATRCGKTHVDVQYVIPNRLIERQTKKGLSVILGVSKSTIERNVLEPMRNLWGDKLITEINTSNIAYLFGQKIYCLGAEKVSQVSKLRGSEIKYAYCDEAVDYNEEVFQMLKSRLSLDYSICDLTGNPSYPTHWLKKFIDSDVDIYNQHWTIDDNPFLSPTIKSELKKEYTGTIYYDRYILGLWKRAEGVIYRKFADDPDRYIIDKVPPLVKISVGVDFGGTQSSTTFVATGITKGFKQLIALEGEKHEGEITPEMLDQKFVEFCKKVYQKYRFAFNTYADNAEPVLIRGLKNAAARANARTVVKNAMKSSISSRIKALTKLIGLDRFKVVKNCDTIITALQEAVWNIKKPDERLDDGTSDIDTLDALEYSFEGDIKNLIDVRGE